MIRHEADTEPPAIRLLSASPSHWRCTCLADEAHILGTAPWIVWKV